MSSLLRVLFLTPLLTMVAAKTYAKCDFASQKEPIKTFAEAFKKSEKLILGEKVSPQKNKGVELIQRNKTKSWKGFDWKLRPLEFFALVASEEKYVELCKSEEAPIFSSVVADIRSQKIPTEDTPKALQSLLLLSPCLETQQNKLLKELSNEYFLSNTEDLLYVLIAAESDTAKYTADYKACSEVVPRKYFISDLVVEGIEQGLQSAPLQKSLHLRLKRLRGNKMQYKTAQYFFKRIDKLLMDKAE